MPTESTYSQIPKLRQVELEYLALQIAKMQTSREFISQQQAHKKFGRDNVERWISENKLQRYKRPGKIEYRLEDLYRCALDPYDY
jgi:hypothetical protein